MPKVRTYEEIRSKMDFWVRKASTCRTKKKLTSCGFCPEESKCDIQASYETLLKLSRKCQ